MADRKFYTFSSLLVSVVVVLATPLRAAPVVELFTSHGCYSCPAADELLGRMVASDADLVALEFHVDYWDTLVYGNAGSWKDPYSDASYTQRQRHYNQRRLDGRTGVYTPQMVINGRYAAVGSQAQLVEYGLARHADEALDVAVQRHGEKLAITLQPVGNNAAHEALVKRSRSVVWLATYDIERVTEITSGENKGLTLTNHRIVRHVEPLSQVVSTTELPATLDAQVQLEGEQGCAIVVQEVLPGDVPGRIWGASNCPG